MSLDHRLRIAIIIGSTRPGAVGDIVGIPRKGEAVGHWALALAEQRDDAEFTLIDLADVDLPFLDEPFPPSFGQYVQAHTRAWAATIGSFDGYVFVTPEYNAATSAALKNAIDFLYAEWANKAAGFVGYGAVGGALAVQNLRGVLGDLGVAAVAGSVSLTLHGDFVDYQDFAPGLHQADALAEMLDQVVAWSTALRPLRESAPTDVALV
jgi:NAD(P)H-dependent FMN reductase